MISKYLLLSIAILFSTQTFSSDYVFQHISSTDGLSNNIVRDIKQSRDGYMWFATSGGLNRYNGETFYTYRPILGDSSSITYSRIYHIFEDSRGFIWATSALGNIHRINSSDHSVDNLWEQNIIPSGSLVRSFYNSSAGDIWLTTADAVLRISYPEQNSPEIKAEWIRLENSGTENTINFLHEDALSNIWIGTEAGLYKISSFPNPKTISETKPDFVYSTISFKTVFETNGKLFFGTGNNKLLVYESSTKVFTEQKKVAANLRGFITAMAVDSGHTLVLGTSVGDVFQYNIQNETITYFQWEKTKNLDEGYVVEILADSYGIFWLVTDKRGVYQFNPKDVRFSYFSLNAENRLFLGETDKQVLLEDSNKDLWIGINGGGLFKYERAKDSFISFKNEPSNSNSISSDIILALYEDRSKNLWIGTSEGGVDKLSLRQEHIRRVQPVVNPKNSFENYVRAIEIDAFGNIWAGSKAGKIYAYKADELIATLPDDLPDPGLLPFINVYSLYFDLDNNLWIGTKGDGLYVVKNLIGNLRTNTGPGIEILHFKHQPDASNSLSSDNIYSVIQDLYGQYWIASFQGGLDQLTDPFTRPSFKNFNSDDHATSSIASNETRDLFLDHAQNLWIATSNGVSVLENKYLLADNKEFINITSSIHDAEKSISGKVVYQINETANNQILLAILDGGVDLLEAVDFETKTFNWKHFSSLMQSPTVYALECDLAGNIWLGADNGLHKLDINADNIEKYGLGNNSSGLNFSESSSRRTPRNELVFGTNEGFITFNPELINKDTTSFPLKFSRLEINGENISGSSASDMVSVPANQLKLKYNQNNIEIYFATLDYSNQEAIKYSYFLDGYDTYWSNASTQNSAAYRKLPPGNYVLHVKSTNGSGYWMKNELLLDLEITPPFFQSVPGYLLLSLLFILAVSGIVLLLRKQIAIRNESKIEHALNERRIQYYTNISSSFKTPLSLILNPAEEIINSHKSSSFSKQNAQIIRKNAIYLKRLIDQILEFRKIREGKMQVKVSKVNLVDFFREVHLVFEPLAKKMEVNFLFECNVSDYSGYADVKILEKVAYNLITNALRHTPAHKKVILSVTINLKQDVVNLEVKDEGVGYSEVELPRIFDRFYDSENTSGIGMFFTKELVLIHKGEIKAIKNPQRGTTFSVSFSTAADKYSADETEEISVSQRNFDLDSVNEIELILADQSNGLHIQKHQKGYINKVLIVSSDNELRKYLSVSISKEFNVEQADNGKEALVKIFEKMPDLILCETNSIKVNGFELTKQVKENMSTSHIPVILLANEATNETRLMSLECGADDLVVKPFNLKYLILKIEKMIAQWKKLKKRFEMEQENEDMQATNSGEDQELMNKVQTIISQNLSNPELNVDYIVNLIGVSRTLFYKKVKSLTGFAPNEYLIILRMKEAAGLLVGTNKSISEISHSVGFADANYFCKIFKRHYGKTPSSYKQIKTGKAIV